MKSLADAARRKTDTHEERNEISVFFSPKNFRHFEECLIIFIKFCHVHFVQTLKASTLGTSHEGVFFVTLSQVKNNGILPFAKYFGVVLLQVACISKNFRIVALKNPR